MTQGIRLAKGATIVEFGGALVILVCFLVIPLIDISMIPVRHLFATGIVNELGYRLGHCRRRSDAYTALASDGWWKSKLSVFGITVSRATLTMMACGKTPNETDTFSQGQVVPPEWLPDGSKGPCVYTLSLSVDIQMSPIYLRRVAAIPFNISSRVAWENLGCDPSTQGYYINE